MSAERMEKLSKKDKFGGRRNVGGRMIRTEKKKS
jgi:hypothetical protein